MKSTSQITLRVGPAVLLLLGFTTLLWQACTPSQTTSDASGKEEVIVEKTPARTFPKEWVSAVSSLQLKDNNHTYARSIIHLHSIYSHDACDGQPRVDGKKNMACLQSLRDALCHNSIDVAFLTEHNSLMGDGDPIADMMLSVKGDEPIQSNGVVVGNRLTCASGHKVSVFPGAENKLMPIGLLRHPTPPKGVRLKDLYGMNTPDAIKRFQEAGGFVLLAHTENKEMDYILKHDIHGVEIFNLHALIDPRKRTGDLKLPGETALAAFVPFITSKASMPHPDLVFLGFHARLKVYMDRWDTLLAKKMIYGYGGSDAHENVHRGIMSDGKRPDSYARMMRWFTNFLRVTDKTMESYRKAIASGQSMLVFELLGTPKEFSFYGKTAEGKRVEMGATTTEKVVSLHVRALHPYHDVDKGIPAQIQLLRIDEKGSKVVAKGVNKLDFSDIKTGTYRVEVNITPIHLAGFMNERTIQYIQEVPWIHSNPIRVGAFPK